MTAPEIPQQPQPRLYPRLGVQTPVVYLPNPQIDPNRWAVVAVDQYTSQPEYWRRVEALVGNQPSTLNLILPEIYLGKPDEPERIRRAQACMRAYLDEGVLEPHEGLIYVEREVEGKTRRGLMLCLDLEQYDYNRGSQSLIRATEGTILERLPPRMQIRRGAALELPHILVLIDDPQETVIEPLSALKQDPARLQPLYDFELMLGSGRLRGYRVADPALEAQVISALEVLADPDCFAQKYGVEPGTAVLLFAMGDGNHSLATAKAVWEELKPQVGLDHPARYALVEIENVHDAGLQFEPIHRVLFDLQADPFEALNQFYQGKLRLTEVDDCLAMMDWINNNEGIQAVGMTCKHCFWVLEFPQPASNLAVGTLQPFVDAMIENKQAARVDYVHGECVICQLTGDPGNLGFFMPHMKKSELFQTVILDGVLPRKTFSMGEAHEKRFYMECRKIEP